MVDSPVTGFLAKAFGQGSPVDKVVGPDLTFAPAVIGKAKGGPPGGVAEAGKRQGIQPECTLWQQNLALDQFFTVTADLGKMQGGCKMQGQRLVVVCIIDSLDGDPAALVIHLMESHISVDLVLPFQHMAIGVAGQAAVCMPGIPVAFPAHIWHLQLAPVKTRKDTKVKAQAAAGLGQV